MSVQAIYCARWYVKALQKECNNMSGMMANNLSPWVSEGMVMNYFLGLMFWKSNFYNKKQQQLQQQQQNLNLIHFILLNHTEIVQFLHYHY